MEPLREIRNRLLNGWQLSKMHTFEVAARHQSFALAAEELSLSPSAVSHRINQLEEELGIQLFVRSHRKVELTHEGKRVYWALKSSLDTLNQEILDIKNQELSGTLTLYSRPSIAQCWSSGIGFDRSDLAVIAAMNHIGVAMGRKRLVQKRLISGELVAPFGDMTVKCHQHYYITTLPGRQWPKIEAFITWLREQVCQSCQYQ
ncbi:LysR family transcriptional regulator [Escherichia coli]|uniref:LysR family transcriptional regulator n=1 Tax=Escherichia coli TaxID=562 RepID=UPI002F26D7F3